MKDKDFVIEVSHVSKSFSIPHERYNSLKQTALNVFRKKPASTYHALKDISFDIERGEFFGIVGRNGSGKSTLLKIIADIYTPDSGHVKVDGRVAPFIELGVGFNPELSGRDNVFLNGALLGMSRAEINRRFDTIVAFAEIEDFIDQKLKNYSSGMQVRLAFSIGLQAEADILLIDEVLAVGDAGFQRKCFEIFRRYKQDTSKTIVFVTHDMGVAEQFCDRMVVVDQNRLIHCGDIDKAIELYYRINSQAEQTAADGTKSEGSSMLLEAYCSDTKTERRLNFEAGEQIKVNIKITPGQKIGGVGMALFKDDGSYCFGTNTFIDKLSPDLSSGALSYTLRDTDKLLPGRYYFKVGLFGSTDRDVLELVSQTAEFRIKGKTPLHGITNMKHEWSFE